MSGTEQQTDAGTPEELTDEGQEVATFGHKLTDAERNIASSELTKEDTDFVRQFADADQPTIVEVVKEKEQTKSTSELAKELCESMVSNLKHNVAEKKRHGKTDVKHYDLLTVRPFLKAQGARLTRKRYAETPIREYLSQIQPTLLAEQYLEFYDAHPFYNEVCAGAKHHHWWKGGLSCHCEEMCGIGLDVMDLYPGDFTFSKSDLIISIFLHDFAKVWAYKYITPEDREKNPKKYHEKQVFTYTDGQFDILNDEARTLLELGRAGIVPTDTQWSAVLFAEGGFSQAMYDFGGRSGTGDKVYARNHLATFLSILDQWSASILGKSLV